MTRYFVLSLLSLLFLPFFWSPATAGEPESCLLRYQLSKDEKIRYQVEHLAKTKTKMRGAEDLSNVRTVSTKVWRVLDVSQDGHFTFDHYVESVAMSQQHGDAEPLEWDSTSGEDPPAIYRSVADQLGKPIAEVRINDRGQEKERKADVGTKTDLGMGGLTIPLPEDETKIGGSWSVPRQIRARTEESEIKKINVRELYTLEKISAGVATISVRSQPLTPISDAKIKSQVVQQLSDGTIKFDIDAGRMISKQLNWDETVIGFQGANSMMEYRARLTEKLVDAPAVAQRPKQTR
ncbi:MAG: hypothetical protein WD119_00620 [Pirellulaceae bacterium]